jgi:4-hydroxy-tetrahydrodipicolinate reductase
MLRLCLVGGLGRMGRAIAALAEADPHAEVVTVWDRPEAVDGCASFAALTGYAKNDVTVTASGEEAVGRCDVVVDFSSADLFPKVLEVCGRLRKPVVTGTTAIDRKQEQIAPLSARIAIVSSPNMAVGMNLVFRLCDLAGRQMGALADVEIVEAHHRAKRDVPSGTALELARIQSAATGKQPKIHSLRIGDVPGRHTVVFALAGETVEVTHNAESRECFAAGALLAARFVRGAKPGSYTMLDVLGSA